METVNKEINQQHTDVLKVEVSDTSMHASLHTSPYYMTLLRTVFHTQP
jgi:hypothetical protein